MGGEVQGTGLHLARTQRVIELRPGRIVQVHRTLDVRHEVAHDAADLPEEWDVHVGTQQTPERPEIFETVQRSVILELLHQWRTVLRRAYDLQLPVTCSGD
jgi:hypothetical protein